MAGDADAFLLLILAFIFPPAAVALVAGCGADLCLNILLTILGYLPGCLHAFWLVIRRAEANERYGYRNWTYRGMGEYVPSQPFGPPSVQASAPYGPPPPPPGPGAQAQAPVDQKGAYAPPAAPAEGKSGGNQWADQKSGGYAPALVPTDQKYTGSGDQAQAPLQAPADQKRADPAAQPSAPTGGT